MDPDRASQPQARFSAMPGCEHQSEVDTRRAFKGAMFEFMGADK
jgi:hypothetical protein